MKVRTDCGTENGIIAAMQCHVRGSADAHIYGTSPENQRIEGWWSFLRRNRTTWWINYFQDLIERELYQPGNDLEEEALWYSFSGVIQEDLDFVKEHWNTHRIRKSSHNTIPGQPEELFHLPELHGGIDGLSLDVNNNEIQFLANELLELDDAESNIFQEYFDHIMYVANLEIPKSWSDAESLYTFFKSVSKE